MECVIFSFVIKILSFLMTIEYLYIFVNILHTGITKILTVQINSDA